MVVFEHACRMGLEGIVSKHREHAYRSGPSKTWLKIKNPDKRTFRKNAYRVLLTRARQGMIIFIPKGSAGDRTTCPEEFDSTAEYLLGCGVIPIPTESMSETRSASSQDHLLLFK